jgi:hypothetical protein
MDPVAVKLRTRKQASTAGCAHCHEAVDTRSVFWRVCAGCLARHHVGCWRSGNGCARCRDSLALLHPDAPSTQAVTRRWQLVLVASVLLLSGICFHLGQRLHASGAAETQLLERFAAEQERARDLADEVERLRASHPRLPER